MPLSRSCLSCNPNLPLKQKLGHSFAAFHGFCISHVSGLSVKTSHKIVIDVHDFPMVFGGSGRHQWANQWAKLGFREQPRFGQWLSMRPDMFPPDVIVVLSKLRADAPAHPGVPCCEEVTRIRLNGYSKLHNIIRDGIDMN